MEEPPSLFECPSWRLIYAITTFSAMAVSLWQNNALNLAILCMTHPEQKRLEISTLHIIVPRHDCPTQRTFSVKTEKLTLSEHQQWMLLSSYYYGYVIVQPIAGRLADKYGGKLFILMATLGQPILFAFIPIALQLDYRLGLVTRSVQGFLAGFLVASIYQLFTVWAHPNERTSLVAVAFAGYTFGSLTVFPLSSFLCSLGWPVVFYFIAAVGFSVGIACKFLVYNKLEHHPWISQKEFDYLNTSNRDKKMAPAIPWKKMFSSVPILTFMMTHFCHSLGIIVLNISLPKFLRDTMDFSIGEIGFYAGGLYVGAFVSKLMVMFTFETLKRKSNLRLTTFRRLIYVCGSIPAICLFLGISILKDRMVIVLFIFLLGFVLDVSFSAGYWVSAIDLAPAFAGLIIGVSNTFAILTGILAPQFISRVVIDGTKEEWNYVYYSLATSYTISTLLYINFGSSERLEWGNFINKTNE